MQKTWRPPEHWQDFEELCSQLYGAELRPTQNYRYGRAGQRQRGVDVAICLAHRSDWIGIQCKLKNELLGGRLTWDEVHEEYQKSTQFIPRLSQLIIATTANRDTESQDAAARISTSFQSQYPVSTVFWQDVEGLLNKHSAIARRFYPEAFGVDSALNESSEGNIDITVTRENWPERLPKFLGHESLCAVAGSHLMHVRTIISELIDNALNARKGNARRVMLSLNDNTLTIRDDGHAFDSLNQAIALKESGKGLSAIRACMDACGEHISHQFTPSELDGDRWNFNTFTIRRGGNEFSDQCVATAPSMYLMSRVAAYEFVDNLPIPDCCDTFTLRLLGDRIFFNASGGSALVEQLLGRLGGRKLLIKISQDCVGYADVIRHEASISPLITVEQV